MVEAKEAQRRKSLFRGGSCGFLLTTSLFACAMLIVNGISISTFYPLIEPVAPRVTKDPRFIQSVMFVGPVLLLLLQWWMIDLLVDMFARHRGPKLQNGSVDESRMQN